MKKILILALNLIAIFNAFCQVEETTTEKFSRKTLAFSIGYSNYSITGSQLELGDSGENMENLSFVTVGLHARQYTNGAFFLEEGVSVIRKGGKSLDGYVNSPRIDDVVLQIPFFGGFQAKSDDVNFSILFGPALNLAIAELDTFDGSHWLNDSFSSNQFVISGIIGVELEKKLNSDNYVFGVFKYDHDITSRIKRSLGDNEYNLKSKGFTFSIGYRFNKS